MNYGTFRKRGLHRFGSGEEVAKRSWQRMNAQECFGRRRWRAFYLLAPLSNRWMHLPNEPQLTFPHNPVKLAVTIRALISPQFVLHPLHDIHLRLARDYH